MGSTRDESGSIYPFFDCSMGSGRGYESWGKEVDVDVVTGNRKHTEKLYQMYDFLVSVPSSGRDKTSYTPRLSTGPIRPFR